MTIECLYTCGHASKISGPEAVQYAEEAKSKYCTACDAFYRRIGIFPVSSAKLVPLLGEDKQITWAKDIRSKIVQRFHELIERAKVQKMSVSDMEKARDAFFNVVQEQAGAKWWIDHRFDAWQLLTVQYEKRVS